MDLEHLISMGFRAAALVAVFLWGRRESGVGRRAHGASLLLLGMWTCLPLLAAFGWDLTGSLSYRLAEVALPAVCLAFLASVVGHGEEENRANRALEASEAKFAAAFQHSRDAVLLTSVPGGEVLEVNRGFSAISGYGRNEAVGRTTLELEVWADLEDRQTMFEALKADGRVEALSVGIRDAKSEIVRPCLLWGEILDLGERRVLLTVVRDISEQWQAEEERAAFVAELEAKNQELEQFAQTVAHDLKNPLLSIQGFLELIADDMVAYQEEVGGLENLPEELDKVPEMVRRTRNSSSRLHRMLDDILELAKAGKGLADARQVDLDALLPEAVEQIAGKIEAHGVEVHIVSGLGTVVGDRTRLVQLFQNLLANAVKFRSQDRAPRIEIDAVEVRVAGISRRVFRVQDNGIGIDPAYVDHVFGLFDRLDKGVEGTGIGLAIVRRIVEVHGGEVWVESEGLGKGSTFCFTLERPPGAMSGASPQLRSLSS